MGQHRTSIWEEWYLILPWFPVGLALINLWGEVFMDNRDLITAIIAAAAVILAALIAGVVALIGQSRQLTRDGKSIDETKAIASDIQPKINNIDHRTEKQAEKIDTIAMEIEIFNRLKSETSGNSLRPEILLASITSVFEENAQLRKQHQNDQQEILVQRAEINELRFRNQQLEAALDQQSPSWEP